MIRYRCNGCSIDLETDDSLAELQEPCPVCGHINSVPKSKQQLKEERRQQRVAEQARQAAELAKKQEQEAARRRAEQARVEESRRAEMAKAEAERLEYETALLLAKKNPETPKNWFCWIDNRAWGPMPESRLQSWISAGRATPNTMVRPEEVRTWIKLSDLPEIFVCPTQNRQNPIGSRGPQNSRDSLLRCQTCGVGNLVRRKTYVMSGPVVVIGYIFLIPSILGILLCICCMIVSSAGGTATGIVGAGSGMCFAVSCFTSGLLGWILVMEKKVLRCDNCGATIAAS